MYTVVYTFKTKKIHQVPPTRIPARHRLCLRHWQAGNVIPPRIERGSKR